MLRRTFIKALAALPFVGNRSNKWGDLLVPVTRGDCIRRPVNEVVERMYIGGHTLIVYDEGIDPQHYEAMRRWLILRGINVGNDSAV